jgi:hypothetical protein
MKFILVSVLLMVFQVNAEPIQINVNFFQGHIPDVVLGHYKIQKADDLVKSLVNKNGIKVLSLPTSILSQDKPTIMALVEEKDFGKGFIKYITEIGTKLEVYPKGNEWLLVAQTSDFSDQNQGGVSASSIVFDRTIFQTLPDVGKAFVLRHHGGLLVIRRVS